MSSRRRLASILLLALLASTPARAGDLQSAARFFGSYRYLAGAEDIRSSIDDLVDRFNLLLRGLARRRLNASTRVPDAVTIGPGEEGVALEVAGALPVNQEARLEGEELVARQSNFEGSRETRLQLSEDGSLLIMRVTTRSPLLPDVLDYRVVFEREPQPRPRCASCHIESRGNSTRTSDSGH